MTKPKLLVVEDDKNTLDGLIQILRRDGYTAVGVSSGYDALNQLSRESFDIVITDMKLPGMGGLSLLQEIKKKNSSIAIVVVTAYSSIKSAVNAVKHGADEYLAKPVDVEELELVLEKLREKQQLVIQNRLLKEELKDKYTFSELVGGSPQMHRIFKMIEDVAPSTASVLIMGETGTGKELVAHAIHYRSERAGKPFVALHCAALSEGILESELFGHEKGAFTGAIQSRKGRFELADGGTLFLDELAEMSLKVQVKLLRVLEKGEFERVGGEKTIKVDVRCIAATNRNLEEEVSEGRFREDLFYRLNVINIQMPPLRERKDDIPILSNYFAVKYAKKYKKEIKGFDPEAIKALLSHHWQGNIRELQNTIERAIVLCKSDTISVDHLPESIMPDNEYIPVIKIPIGTTLKEAEKEIIQRTLQITNGSKQSAAKILGISTRKIEYKTKEWC
ncbi:transcriptional regulatory protein ZraR [Candidatus Kuenenia stuttgartiensis]|jgi:DNA-binding NtrC family response regulator|uniref:Strongly similar to sigma 54 response regulatory protein n=1 Tax=Kuenenia stuttgartiensis TaxID=174633 RepID=Q1PYI3_KUEST|nr:sigma-54 dependent transcriptional regulator [Candidatus Kuenenia stuttgartiensis]MBE7547558.1 sigma-54-dependent Fis family transcriptional regulator [Planctomycetia bacterium]MBZ0193272.1 sigma-54 dependent transcriptional regulator [Candidatus Kuenenia stuttgartiensis]MCF6152108.1 sigma-54-dependent Fis family transcriptional regulator [Candidatus Kuenenia stuttgartiensis]QII10499.1 transcriptional regulatory protein ZraR [Candidatus Kuenenia stuttgartiensis]CAJ72143.1 strongly similar t